MSNIHEPQGPNFRLVEKNAVPANPTREDFEAYLLYESGGVVFLDDNFPIELWSEDERYYKVPCYSFDGGGSGPTHPVNAVFPKSGCLSDAEIEEQIRRFGNG